MIGRNMSVWWWYIDDLSEDNLSADDLSKYDLSENDRSKYDPSEDDRSEYDLSEDNLSNYDLSEDDLSEDDLSGEDLSSRLNRSHPRACAQNIEETLYGLKSKIFQVGIWNCHVRNSVFNLQEIWITRGF